MKIFIACTLVLLFNTTTVYGQSDFAWVNNWEKILISDSYMGWSHFNHNFQIVRKNLSLTTQDRPDSIIKQIDINLIDSLLQSLKNSNQLRLDPLIMFDRDSTWLIENAEALWSEYLRDRKESEEIDSIAINTIIDYEKTKRAVFALQGSIWTDDYPNVSVTFIKGNDSLSISSNGQYPYMLPWKVEGVNIYNSRISQLIAQLPPDNHEGNKSRLQGDKFNYYLINRIYSAFIEENVEFTKAKNKYTKQFKYLENEFEIKKAEMSYMSSIEWGGWFGRPALEILLADSSISNQIQFSTVFGRHHITHSPKSIIRNKDKIINRLEGNPVFDYTINCNNCAGEIHWVKSKSLSNEAKRNFLSDVKDNGLKKRHFRGKFRNAIFFELTEFRDSKSSFSRWIFLQNGMVILWQLQGEYLMNLPDTETENQGYICKVFKGEELQYLKDN